MTGENPLYVEAGDVLDNIVQSIVDPNESAPVTYSTNDVIAMKAFITLCSMYPGLEFRMNFDYNSPSGSSSMVVISQNTGNGIYLTKYDGFAHAICLVIINLFAKLSPF
jgi:hypothetical protein